MNKLKQYDYRFDNSAIDQNGNLKNNLVVTTPEVQVYAHKNNQYPYSSTYDPNGLSQFANIATLGGLNNLSPTQWARRAYDAYKGQLDLDNFINGNNGIVSNNYAKQHPYMSMGANMLGDIALLGGAGLLKNSNILRNSYKGLKNSIRKFNRPTYERLEYDNLIEGVNKKAKDQLNAYGEQIKDLNNQLIKTKEASFSKYDELRKVQQTIDKIKNGNDIIPSEYNYNILSKNKNLHINFSKVNKDFFEKNKELNKYKREGINLNDYTNQDFNLEGEVPKFGSNETVPFNININSNSRLPLKNFIIGDRDKYIKTSSNKILSTYNQEVPKEYPQLLKNNIEYLQNTFPGFKPFGSSVTAEHGLPHVTHDFDGLITSNDFQKVKSKFGNQWVKTIPGETYTGNLRKLGYEYPGDSGNIDFNVIDGQNDRSWELYRQFFPDEYANAVKKGLSTGQYTINKTPKELLDAVNPYQKTLMDLFEIDTSKSYKQAGRLLWQLNHGNANEVSNALDKSVQSLAGTKLQKPPMNYDFSDPERNRKILDKMTNNYQIFSNDIVNDPKKMENVYKQWWYHNTIKSRGSNSFDRATNTESFDKYGHRNMFQLSDEHIGGSAGTGLNAVDFGNSNGTVIGETTQYAHFQPKLKIDSGTQPEEAIDNVNHIYGRNDFTAQEKKDISDILDKTKLEVGNDDKVSPYLLGGNLGALPKAKTLTELSDKLGMYAFPGSEYGNSTYSGLLRSIPKDTPMMIHPANYPAPENFNMLLPRKRMMVDQEKFNKFEQTLKNRNTRAQSKMLDRYSKHQKNLSNIKNTQREDQINRFENKMTAPINEQYQKSLHKYWETNDNINDVIEKERQKLQEIDKNDATITSQLVKHSNLNKKRYEARRKLKKYVKVGAATTAVAAAGTAKVIMSNKNKKK